MPRSFKSWIRDYQGHESFLGALSKSILRDKRFPGQERSYEKLAEHINVESKGRVDTQTWRMFQEAYRRYAKEELEQDWKPLLDTEPEEIG